MPCYNADIKILQTSTKIAVHSGCIKIMETWKFEIAVDAFSSYTCLLTRHYESGWSVMNTWEIIILLLIRAWFHLVRLTNIKCLFSPSILCAIASMCSCWDIYQYMSNISMCALCADLLWSNINNTLNTMLRCGCLLSRGDVQPPSTSCNYCHCRSCCWQLVIIQSGGSHRWYPLGAVHWQIKCGADAMLGQPSDGGKWRNLLRAPEPLQVIRVLEAHVILEHTIPHELPADRTKGALLLRFMTVSSCKSRATFPISMFTHIMAPNSWAPVGRTCPPKGGGRPAHACI